MYKHFLLKQENANPFKMFITLLKKNIQTTQNK